MRVRGISSLGQQQRGACSVCSGACTELCVHFRDSGPGLGAGTQPYAGVGTGKESQASTRVLPQVLLTQEPTGASGARWGPRRAWKGQCAPHTRSPTCSKQAQEANSRHDALVPLMWVQEGPHLLDPLAGFTCSLAAGVEGGFLRVLRCLEGTYRFSASIGGVRLLGAPQQVQAEDPSEDQIQR